MASKLGAVIVAFIIVYCLGLGAVHARIGNCNVIKLDNISCQLDKSEIEWQQVQFKATRAYEDAVLRALDSFLNDGEAEESLRAIFSERFGDNSPADIQSELLKLVDKHENRFSILAHSDGQRADGGESLEANWIFYLEIPSLSDHVFWAIVPRDSSKFAYNCGFN